MTPFEIIDQLQRTVTDSIPLWTSPIIEAGWPRCITPWVPWSSLEWEDWLSEFEGHLDEGGYLGGTMFACLIREGDPGAQLALALAVRVLAHEIVDRAAKLLTYSKIRAGRQYVRWCAGVCLGVCGPRAKPAVPRLLSRLAKERTPIVRVVIAWALTQIDPHAARQAFETAVLFDGESTVRGIAGNSLGRDGYALGKASMNSRGLCAMAGAN